MRPGPGLVVMALAFISGARRGSTSTSSKISSSSTLPSSSSSRTSSTSDAESSPSALFLPAYIRGVLAPPAHVEEREEERERDRNAYRSSGYKYYNYNTYPPPSLQLPKFLQQTYENSRTSSGGISVSRSTRANRGIRSINTASVGARSSEIGGNDRNTGNVDGDDGAEGDIEGNDKVVTGAAEIADHIEDKFAVDSSGNGFSEGLFVRFPSNSAESSRSVEEDDILLALVAEDDFLSEESFDRLTTFTDDKIGYINEKDYGGTEGRSDSGGSGGGKNNFADAAENQPHDENHTADYKGNVTRDDDEADGDDSKIAFTANLISNSNNIAAIAETFRTNLFGENSLSSATVTESKRRDIRWSIFDSESPLTRLNPWISACDLAQPGTAPDLQGQCSAGTLPVAWVDEGPGPPTCPMSCEQLRLNNVDNFNNNTVNNKIHTNNSSFKPNNYKNNYDNKTMPKVRRDVNVRKIGNGSTVRERNVRSEESSPASTPTKRNDKDTTLKSSGADLAIAIALTAGSRQNQNNNNIVKVSASHGEANSNYQQKFGSDINNNNNNNNNRNHYVNKQKQHTDEPKHHPQQEQQCLDYLGDTEETSPVHLCTFKSPGKLVARLRSLRLKHCCERNVFSALHTVALNATISGGVECVRVLMDVMDLDILASRITCELAEILFRFDCRQVYSLIHQCDDCKEAYRRWVCSTLVPYFAEQDDVVAFKSSSSSTNLYNGGVVSVNSSTKTSNESGARRTALTAANFNSSNLLLDMSQKVHILIVNDDSNSNSNSNNNTDMKYAATTNEETGRSKRRVNAHSTTTRPSCPLLVLQSPPSTDKTVGDRKYNYTTATATGSASASASTRRKHAAADSKCTHKQGQLQQRHQQSHKFISTAKNADPCEQDPVISKLNKRSKRKVEFRKRRRIRPCLSVCQTVEQKCPYLLPADRAPALPTQYAGEPTFLCLDQNIPETGEQLRKSSYGPTDCCYAYCNNIADGICAHCNQFTSVSSNNDAPPPATKPRRLHNITMTATSQHRLDARLEAVLTNDTNRRTASVSIALNNATTALSNQVQDGLPHFAICEGTYFFDDDITDMPEDAISDDCPPVPSVTSRCSIPYYASSATAQRTSARKKLLGQHFLLFLSALLCLLSSHTAVLQQRRLQKCNSAGNATRRAKTARAGGRAATGGGGGHRCAQYLKRSIATQGTNSTNTKITNIVSENALVSFAHTNDDCRYSSDSFSRWKEKKDIKQRKRASEDPSRTNRTISSSSKYMKLSSKLLQNIRTTYRLNSTVYFSSNTKAYRSKNCSKFINCNNIITANNYSNNSMDIITKVKIANNTNNVTMRINNDDNTNKIQNNYMTTKNIRIDNNNRNNRSRSRNSINKHNSNYYKYECNITIMIKYTNRSNNKTHNNGKNYRFFYYYNFNVNDWWRRWWWTQAPPNHHRRPVS